MVRIKSSCNPQLPKEDASNYAIGTTIESKDGTLWKVSKDDNGNKKWEIIIEQIFDFEDYVRDAFDELFKKGIVAIKKSWRTSFSDDAWDDTVSKIKNTKKIGKQLKRIWGIDVDNINDIDIDKHVPFVYYLYPGKRPINVFIKHNLPKKEHTKIVKKILSDHFGKNFSWNGSGNSAIEIKTGLRPLPKPRGRKKTADYGANWDLKTKNKLHKWLKEYPNAKFKKIGKDERWTSPAIEKMLDQYKKVDQELRLMGDKDQADYYKNEILPLTPWISPIEAESEMQYTLDNARSYLDEIISSKI